MIQSHLQERQESVTQTERDPVAQEAKDSVVQKAKDHEPQKGSEALVGKAGDPSKGQKRCCQCLGDQWRLFFPNDPVVQETGGSGGGQNRCCQCTGDLWSKFLLDYAFPAHFVTSQWQADPNVVSRYFLAYRAVMAAYTLASYFDYIFDRPPMQLGTIVIFLTTFGITILTVQQLLDFTLVAVVFWMQQMNDRLRVTRMSIPFRINWVLSNLATGGAPVITLMYWYLVFPDRHDKSKPVAYETVFAHGVNSVIVLTDLLVTARPWRWHHFYHLFIFAVTYGVFSWVYFEAWGRGPNDEPYIYRPLDWTYPARASLIAIGGQFTIVLCHFGMYGLFRLRRMVYRKLRPQASLAPLVMAL